MWFALYYIMDDELKLDEPILKLLKIIEDNDISIKALSNTIES